MTQKKIGQRKYQADVLVSMFRKATKFRNEMVKLGFTDNAGAIHSAERILNLLGLALKYPDIPHGNNLKYSKYALFSQEAWVLHKSGKKVLIEHVSPLRDLTRKAIAQVDNMEDEKFKSFVRRNYKLALLSPAETQRLNKLNRSKMHPNRLKLADIKLLARRIQKI